MTGIEIPVPRQAPPERPIRVRLPASRGGLAWLAVLLIVGTFLAVQVGREVYSSWSIGQEADQVRAQIAAMEARACAGAASWSSPTCRATPTSPRRRAA